MEKQQELFDEFNKSSEVKRPASKRTAPERMFTLFLTYEKLILFVIGFVAILTAVFVIGFERGKKVILSKTVIKKAAVKTPEPAVKEKKIRKEIKKGPVRVMTPKQISNKAYTIQVATFRSERLAQEESGRLKQRGFISDIVEKSGFYQVLVGEYLDSKDATSTLAKLKKVYTDCYVRKR